MAHVRGRSVPIFVVDWDAEFMARMNGTRSATGTRGLSRSRGLSPIRHKKNRGGLGPARAEGYGGAGRLEAERFGLPQRPGRSRPQRREIGSVAGRWAERRRG